MTEQDHLEDVFTIEGTLNHSCFVPWIKRHAQKLGLRTQFISINNDTIDLNVYGPPDLVDALEMGCLLGPIEVWVQELKRVSTSATTAGPNA